MNEKDVTIGKIVGLPKCLLHVELDEPSKGVVKECYFPGSRGIDIAWHGIDPMMPYEEFLEALSQRFDVEIYDINIEKGSCLTFRYRRLSTIRKAFKLLQ